MLKKTERKGKDYRQQQQRMVSVTSVSAKAQRASYLVAQRIAKARKPHTIGEELLLPAAVDLCEVMVGKDAAAKLRSVPLSNDTIRRRIEDMSNDIKSQLLERLRVSKFAVQLDESTDVSGSAQLIALVRYPWEGRIQEDFLFCQELTGRATGEEIFNVIDMFMETGNVSWENCIAICTDGAAAMTGRKSGVVARAKERNPMMIATHCMLHRQALASKSLSPELHSVLSTVVSVVNHIKCKPLQSRVFGQLCREMGAGQDTLLFHSEVRWLSRGKVLQRVYELRSELCEFIQNDKPTTAALFSDPEWIAQLAYLADVFNLLNNLSLSVQGRYASILEVSDKIKAFRAKTAIWRRRVQNGITDMFPQLTEFLDTNQIPAEIVKNTIGSHLASLGDYFNDYFTDVDTDAWDWVRDPFVAHTSARGLSGKAEEELLDLACDGTLRIRFGQGGHVDFWPSVEQEYPELAAVAMQVLLPFPTTYLCESSFSALTSMKTKYRARMEVENDLRVCLSSTSPRMEKLCSERRAHISH
ncbi:SCAN domain-containing protein 3-like [Centroberyx affinis]|uniref:SCAN domain-containing protein 3-like n=1 Tax=Centroberyx affinis TaxID=166261 RepID=UPI003A5C14A8